MDKTELYLKDLNSNGRLRQKLTSGKDFLYSAEIFRDKLYVTTNEDAPRFRVFVADVTSRPSARTGRNLSRRLTPCCKARPDRRTENFSPSTNTTPVPSSSFSISTASRSPTSLCPPSAASGGVGGRYDRNEVFFDFQSFTVPPSIYRYDLTARKTTLWDKVQRPHRSHRL